ncbi:MAG: hypothetical protein R6V44_00955 [Paracoccaceae bacterium]
MSATLRDCGEFDEQDLLSDPPLSRIDPVSRRNVPIDRGPEAQRQQPDIRGRRAAVEAGGRRPAVHG